jgi:ribosomal protein S18 acetylase RimI-like enzyme
MTPVQVRPAALDDFAAVTALLEELGRPKVGPGEETPARTVFERHLRREDTASLVATADGQVIGFMSLEFRDRLNRTTPQGWIPDLIVTDSARGIGAGKALLRRGIELCRERGCCRVTLETGYERTVAHKLYEAAGMVNKGYFFTLPL